jgi:glycosyltransferase involved in cell wall biosynthesis
VLRNSIYFRLKPFVPKSVRMAVRRAFAARKRRHVGHVWPVMPGSERPPQGWPGWPQGKKFAFVLTHDVESRAGLDRVRALAELEMAHGFRASFNFIPESDYSVPLELRAWLAGEGFEIGVHDLKHDGHLFDSRKTFRQDAQRINAYMKAWGATGFRSGFMLSELEWLHDLNIRYDASTFDTDPFEPQPEGRHTIFPFWMARPGAKNADAGYVELPYTLPQDSTLFLLLRERTIEIWKRKLDWIAGHGGMAIMNVHPDYIQFGGEKSGSHTYSSGLFAELLRYVKEKYEGQYWHALPREVAEFAAPLKPAAPHQPKRICMVAYSHYESDGRVKRYAEALAERGDRVDVLALKRSPAEPDEASVGGVRIRNLISRVGKTEHSPAAFLMPVLRFLWRSTFWIAKRHLRERYDVFHVHNMPDFLVFAAALPKLMGAKVILDIHDIVPEFYGNKFGGAKKSPVVVVALLKGMERICAAVADKVIISNHLWLEKYARRTGANGKCSVFINHVDGGVFQPHERTRQDKKSIILFPGGLQWHQGLDIALRAFKRVRRDVPNAEFHIYGDGSWKTELVRLAESLECNGSVRFFDPVRITEIASIMTNADLGVVPKRADSFGNEAYSTKIMEFMSVGVPVIVSETKIDRYYFNDSVVRFFESGNDAALAVQMRDLLQKPEERKAMAVRAREYAMANCWEGRKGDYLKLVDSLSAS